MSTCPCCDSDTLPTLLGTLGTTVWLRCRDCGIDYRTNPETLAALCEETDEDE